ncbi:MAG TPA: hypothetical protein VL307_10100 [Chitinophagaceae bacterium]|nr:hypothetical protein [Chitinophagaceae bacterium]
MKYGTGNAMLYQPVTVIAMLVHPRFIGSFHFCECPVSVDHNLCNKPFIILADAVFCSSLFSFKTLSLPLFKIL